MKLQVQSSTVVFRTPHMKPQKNNRAAPGQGKGGGVSLLTTAWNQPPKRAVMWYLRLPGSWWNFSHLTNQAWKVQISRHRSWYSSDWNFSLSSTFKFHLDENVNLLTLNIYTPSNQQWKITGKETSHDASSSIVHEARGLGAVMLVGIPRELPSVLGVITWLFHYFTHFIRTYQLSSFIFSWDFLGVQRTTQHFCQKLMQSPIHQTDGSTLSQGSRISRSCFGKDLGLQESLHEWIRRGTLLKGLVHPKPFKWCQLR